MLKKRSSTIGIVICLIVMMSAIAIAYSIDRQMVALPFYASITALIVIPISMLCIGMIIGATLKFGEKIEVK